jgi:acyl carrier protein
MQLYGTQPRLIRCFQTVFPGLSEAEALAANPENTSAWDSVAAIMLFNVIEEEFQIQIDLDLLTELDSLPLMLDYVTKQLRVKDVVHESEF